MKPVFADTHYYLALLNIKDRHHIAVHDWISRNRKRILTTEWVLLEVGDALSSASLRGRFVSLRDVILTDPFTTVVASTPILFEQGCNLYASRADKDWSLTDCISFEVMKQQGLTEALTADRHFEQAGFAALLRDAAQA